MERPESLLADLAADLRRYLPGPGPHRLRARLDAVTTYGFLATAIYRYGRLCRRIRPWSLSLPPKLLYHLLRLFCELGMGIYICASSRIGPGLHIGHFGGIVISADIGAGCTLSQGVTIGYRGAGRSTERPRIGDGVYLGAGAMVIGAVQIGEGCVIGANTTVTKSIPPHHRVVSAAVRIEPLPDAQQRPESDSGA